MKTYSTEYTAILVNILSFVLPQIGVSVGSDALTTTIQTVVAIATGLFLLVKRHKRGGVNALGVRTEV